MAFFVYVLKSVDGRINYVGSTENIADRLERHNDGRSKATKAYRPFVLVHQEEFSSRAEAYSREMYYKTGKGREELAKYIRS